ncbi:hypothetical protein D3C73_1132780 [compost metagenome]
MIEGEVATLERAQAIADVAVLAGKQFDRQGQVLEAQTVGYVVMDPDVQWQGKVVLDFKSHFTPTAEGQATGHLSLYAGGGQAFETQGVEHSQGQ